MTDEQLARFVAKTDRSGECWIWTAARYPNGYGAFGIDGKPKLAHRVAFAHWKGSIPEGLTIDHLCRNKSCVNPAHLEAVTQRVNVRRGEAGNRCRLNFQGKKQTPEHIAKRVARNTGRKHSPETLAKMANSRRAYLERKFGVVA